MAFQGTLETFNLADVFQNLAQNHQTGTLHLKRDDGEERHLYFHEGKLMYLSKGKDIGLIRDGMYVARGVCDPSQLQKAQQMAQNSSKTLGQCLVSLNISNPQKIGEVARFYMEEETYELFLWPNAAFEFVETPPEEGLFTDLSGAQYNPIEVANLIMEAARRIDEWDRLLQHIGSMKEIFVFEDTLKEAANRGEFELAKSELIVMATMNAGRDLDDIVHTTYLSPFEVATATAGFVQASMARKATVDELKSAVTEAELVQDKGRCIKLYERILSLNSDDIAIRRKLADMLPDINRKEDALVHYNVLADSAFATHRDEEAVELYNLIIGLDPANIMAHTRLVDLMNRLHQEEKAGDIAFKLAGILTQNDRNDEAIQACEKAVQSDIKNIEYRAELVQLLLKVNEKSRAAKELEMIGDILHKQGKNRAAADTYKRAMTLDRNLTHLKKKLQDVLLSEDEKRKQKTRLVLIVLGVLLVIGLGVAGATYYINQNNALRDEYQKLFDKLPPMRNGRDALLTDMKKLEEESINEIPTSVSFPDNDPKGPEEAVKTAANIVIGKWKAAKEGLEQLEIRVKDFNTEVKKLQSEYEALQRKADNQMFGIGRDIPRQIRDDRGKIEEIPKALDERSEEIKINIRKRIADYYEQMKLVNRSTYDKKLYALIVIGVSDKSEHKTDAENVLELLKQQEAEIRGDQKTIEDLNSDNYWKNIQSYLQSNSQADVNKIVNQLAEDNKKKLDLFEKYWNTKMGVKITLGMVVYSDVAGGHVKLDNNAEEIVGSLYSGQARLILYNPTSTHVLSWGFPDTPENPIQSRQLNPPLPLYTFFVKQLIYPIYSPVWKRNLEASPTTPIIKINDIFYIGMKNGFIRAIDPASERDEKIQLIEDEPSLEIHLPPTWDAEKGALYWSLHNKSNRSALVRFSPQKTGAKLGGLGKEDVRIFDTIYGKFIAPISFGNSIYFSWTRLGVMLTDTNVVILSMEDSNPANTMKVLKNTPINFPAAVVENPPAIIVKYAEKDASTTLQDYLVVPHPQGKLVLYDMRSLITKGGLEVPQATLNPIVTPLLAVPVTQRINPIYVFGVGGSVNAMYMVDFEEPEDKRKIVQFAAMRMKGELQPFVYQDLDQLFFCTKTHIYGVRIIGVNQAQVTSEIEVGAVPNGPPAFYKNILYIGTADGTIIAFNLRGPSGVEVRWRTNVPGNSPIIGQPVIFEDKVFFLTADGNIYAYRIAK